MLESENASTPTVNYARARFYVALEVAAVCLILVLCSLRAQGAPPGPGSGSPAPKKDVSGKLRSAKALDRLRAAEDLRELAAQAPPADIEAAYRGEKNVQVRYSLLQGLASQAPAQGVVLLAEALSRDPAVIVRVVAAQELARFDEPAAAGALAAAAAADQDADVRKACLSSLGLQRSSGTIEALSLAATDPDPEIRKHAALGLSRQPKGPAVDRALDELEKDPDPRVKAKAKAWRKR